MKIRLLLLVLATLTAWSPDTPAQVQRPKPPLELTAEILSQNYCDAGSGLEALEMNLKLRYRNIGKQKLLLYKGHDLFYQTRIRSTTADMQPNEVLFLNSRYFDEEFEPIDQPLPSKVFAVLSPGTVYERKLVVGLPVASIRVGHGDSTIVPGDYTLQLIVSTWYKTRKLAEKLRAQWERKGLLWFDPVVSAPIQFRAERLQSLAPCKRMP